MATQNPWFQTGTFALPESQLDRFLMRISLGYPDERAERRLLMAVHPREQLATVRPILDGPRVQALHAAVDRIAVSEAVVAYLQRLVAFTRQDVHYAYGLSSRAAMA